VLSTIKTEILGRQGLFSAVGKVNALNSGEVCWISQKIVREGSNILWVMVGKPDSDMISGHVDAL
jgi:hypothetical protein